MRLKALTLAVLILAMLVVPASAHNITIVDPMDCYTYSLYTSDGMLVGEYTANDTLYLNTPGDYRIFVKPSAIDIAKDPLVTIVWYMAYLPVMLAAGLIFMLLLGLVLIARRVLR